MKVIKGLVLLCLMMLAGCQSEEETSQFLLACKYDAPATIAAMLDNGIDVDGQDKTGLSGLMVAAAENRRDVVELLLKRRAKPNLQTRQGVTALMLAAARGSDTAIIGDLLQAGASVNQTSIDKSTALMSAISDGGDVRNDYQHILAMKKPDAPVEEESTLDKIVGATAVKSLATGNRALMTEDMALQLAPGAFKKNVDEIVALLLKHGADVKAVNASGESAFFLAVDHARSAETITTLANAGADTSLADKSGTTPLMLALSASGVEVDQPNREGLTALQVAAGQGAPAVIAALAQRGAKVDQLSANDLSPLMLAVKMNNKANVEALLAAGASVNLSNKAGYTAIGYSRAGEVRQLLLAQHAELKGQAAHMAQSELQFCANAFADKLAYSDIARAVNNDTRPDIMRHQQSCPELGELTMLLGEFTFTPAGATYLGEPVTCKVSEYRKTFEVNCR
ncbi:ankyrin repeat domain-containing protein [Klebsiella pneumoniae]|uniref:ankyrin repeat domain-containing protein n=1 Tax=Klebsiella pneumoniae TaxID=573 RepID=UPI0021D4E8C7|nr:ankyrin repeat domain-containing protein [Klebsiella pneumoniae]MCU6859025.1 ankyrin repeat domain-containing protein [Klebsiella pneumoniae]MCU6868524.1 ankyrin repeat domain-containing protein [Klebsiella pneumoniae]MCU6887580.1 ankyrin repeat domain-containing protein [Klebsiella pneumoniae]MCU6901932.1 ankyrin repeat domain-containing protein [Klebsiella pneumoniae]MCU6916279.1 ankyrin repeat domain-containing protein [Klebsiella pneumoniae]